MTGARKRICASGCVAEVLYDEDRNVTNQRGCCGMPLGIRKFLVEVGIAAPSLSRTPED